MPMKVYTYEYDELVAGTFPVVSASVTLVGGVVYARGSLLGLASSGANAGKCALSAEAAADGSQVIYGILPEEIDATAGDTGCRINITGEYATDQVVVGAGWTPATAKAALLAANSSLYLIDVKALPGIAS